MPVRIARWCAAVSLFALLAIGLAPPQAIARQGPPGAFLYTIEAMKRSIAPVVCRTGIADRPVSAILGTAFFVSAEGEFVTAAHVLQTAPANCDTAIYVPLDGWRSEADAIRLFNFQRQRRRIETNADVAVCQTTVPPATVPKVNAVPVTLDAEASPVEGTEVAFTGFPLRNAEPLTARGFLAGYRNPSRVGGERWILDRAAWPGSSGSPVYLDDGRVIGIIIQRGINDGSGLAYARPASQIVASVRAFREAAAP